jgi:High-temperature-induced dauer-formation protein
VERNTTKEVLNCLRILQRVLPVIFEVEGESSVFELEVLWKKQEAGDSLGDRDTTEAPQFVIEDDDDCEDDQGNSRAKGTTSEPKDKKTLPSLGERLLSCLIDLMFCCGFTLPSKIQVDHHKINYVIWCVVHLVYFPMTSNA